MLNKLRTVIYHTNDIVKATAWYTALTGIQPYFDESIYLGVDINACELGLDPNMNQIRAGNHTVAYWSVNDIDAVVKKAFSLGGEIFFPVTNVGGSIEVATIADPFGNHIGFIKGA